MGYVSRESQQILLDHLPQTNCEKNDNEKKVIDSSQLFWEVGRVSEEELAFWALSSVWHWEEIQV